MVSIYSEVANTFSTGDLRYGVYWAGLQHQDIQIVVFFVQKEVPVLCGMLRSALDPIKHKFPNKLIVGVRTSQTSCDINEHAGTRVLLEKDQNKDKGNWSLSWKKKKKTIYWLLSLFLDVLSQQVLADSVNILYNPGFWQCLCIHGFMVYFQKKLNKPG